MILSGLRADLRRLIAAALAVVLGVGFLAATLVLGDTMRGGFRDVFVAGNDGVAVVVRSDSRLGNDDRAIDLGTVPATLLDELRLIDGIASAALHVEGRAQIVDGSGRAVGGDGPPTLAANWIEDPALSPWRIAEGRAPAGPEEVVVDRASARRAGLAVGDTVTIRTPDRLEATLVGVATFAGADGQGPVTQTLFDTETAQMLFLGDRSSATAIRAAARAGVDDEAAAERVAAVLPPGTEVVTGSDLAVEQLADLEGDFIGFFQGLLLVFAGVGLVVATLTIHNTFAIIVAHRGRRSALLRAIGASRRQVLVGVGVEAAAVGVVASVVGIGVGVALAALALAGMDAAGFGIPGSMRWSSRSLATAWATGVVVASAAAVLPAVHASRVAPLAATRELTLDRSGTSRPRQILGTALAAVAAAALVGGIGGDEVSTGLAAIGGLLAVASVVVWGPVLAGPLAMILGWPVAAVRGRSGVLARRNAVRNPRRTASTASSLMVGVAVVVFFATTAFSLTKYIDRTVQAQFGGDLVIQEDGFSGPGLSSTLASRLDQLDETEVVVPMATGVLRAGDRELYPTVTDPALLGHLLDLDLTAGALEGLADTEVAVSERLAAEEGWQYGDTVAMTVGGAEVHLSVGAVYASRDLVGDLLVSTNAWHVHGPPTPARVVLVGIAPGVEPARAQQAVARVAADEAAPAPLDREQYVDRVAGEIDQMIAFMFALLAIAVLIAVMGIGNTMSLAVHERTRELGLLRAVGMGRGAVRAVVRWESAIVAAFGSALGLVLGTGGAWVAVRAFAAAEGVELSLALPVTTFAVVLGLGAAAGVLAGLRPAHRAARVDVLEAIAVA